MSLSIFRRIEPPIFQVGLAINQYATWLTWSEPFRRFLGKIAHALQTLPTPPLVCVSGLDKYNLTYSYPPSALGHTRRQFLGFARSLSAVQPQNKLFLLHDLFTPDLDGPGLCKVFAFLRGTLVELIGEDHAAMYTPLGQTGSRVGNFPLHADLYIPRILFNVFEAVPDDETGASLFLPVSTLRKLMAEIMSLPYEIESLILRLLEEESDFDGFEILDNLLHGQGVWVRELEKAMECNQVRIKLHSGQGYLLDDRRWLHGREAPNGGVPSNRLHRLVFSRERSHDTRLT
jgi:hypothetical protein